MLINTQRVAPADWPRGWSESNLFKEPIMTAKNTAALSALSAMSLSALTALYNEHAAKPIKKFACSKDAAVAKVLAVLPKTAAKGEKKPRGLGIGAYVKELLAKGEKPADILAAVLKRFPDAKTTMKCVYWYANTMRNA